MKELFDSLWKIAPRFMSLVVILGVVFYVSYEVARFQQKVDNMDKRLVKVEDKLIEVDHRLTRVEVRLDRLEQKVEAMDQKLDRIIDYLLIERSKGK